MYYLLIAVVVTGILLLRLFLICTDLFWNLYDWDKKSLALTVLRIWVWDGAKIAYLARPYAERTPQDNFDDWINKKTMGVYKKLKTKI